MRYHVSYIRSVYRFELSLLVHGYCLLCETSQSNIGVMKKVTGLLCFVLLKMCLRITKSPRADWRNKYWQLRAKSDKSNFVLDEGTTACSSDIRKIFCVFMR